MTITDLKSARQKLKANDPSIGLPGREDKIRELEDFLFERLKAKQSVQEKRARNENAISIKDLHDNKTVFICGVPGTGKTAVVLNVVEKLLKKTKVKNTPLSRFQYLYVNAQHLSSPEKVYSEIFYQITNKKCAPEKAQDELEAIFTSVELKTETSTGKKATRRKTTSDKNSFYIIIIDELDLLYSDKRESVFYSLFDWPTSHKSRVILVTIANAMDLPERHMRGRIGSRLGWNKIVFEPYTSNHLESILRAKLGQDLMNKCFEKNAILVATKRIGKTSGDARRIIDTCCLAVEEAIQEGAPKVTSAIVDRVGFQNLDRMKIDYVQTCPPLELIVLKAILNESVGHGEEGIFAYGVYKQVENILRLSSHPWLKEKVLAYDEYHELLNTLQAVGLIAIDDQRTLLQKRLFIKDTSDSFRDVIREARLEMN